MYLVVDVLKTIVYGILLAVGIIWLYFVVMGVKIKGEQLMKKYPTLKTAWDLSLAGLGLFIIFFLLGIFVRGCIGI